MEEIHYPRRARAEAALIDSTLFITGAQRSGTTLFEKLIGTQQRISMLSQPFPLLFSEVKGSFLRTGERYPLGHLFQETRYSADDFATFLESWRVDRESLRSVFARMETYSGQYTRFTRTKIDDAIARIDGDAGFADVVASLEHSLASKRDALWFGSKETMCEEYVPAFVNRGLRCAIILRDPRDVVASLNHGRGREFGGELKPTLFNIRAWRKSVAIAIAMQDHSRFHWCRYEDVVRNPHEALERFARALNVDIDSEDIGIRDANGGTWRGNSSHREHDGIVLSSIGSWRELLPDSAAMLIEAACLPELQLLGYETTLSFAEARRVLEHMRDPYTSTRSGMERDLTNEENAKVEVERLDRISSKPDAGSSQWFLSPQTHAALAGAFRG